MFSARAALSAFLLASSAVLAQTTHNVLVGSSGLTFTPNQVTAAVGDIVAFEFHPKNHTLTQSTFANPCVAMEGGVGSGYIPVATTDTTFPVFSFKVNEVTPLWFYCAQGTHCASGMVFAINVNASSPNTFDAYLAKATGGAAAGASVTASGTAGVPAATGSSGVVGPASVTSASSAATGSAASASGTTTPNSASRMAVGSGASLLLTAVGMVAALAL